MSKEIPFEKSFASHEKAKYWSDKNILKPNQVSLNSHKKCLFNCKNCSHEFLMMISNINKGQFCSYCNGNHKLCDKEDCKKCYEKSFACHEKAIYWSDKNELKPRQVFKNSNTKHIFKCDICNHEFEIRLSDVYSKNHWCGYCANRKLCEKGDCQICFEKSFASHEKAQYWSDKNELKPNQVFKSSGNKYWFKCNDCNHNFNTRLSSITDGIWCPYCNGNHSLCNNDECKQCFKKSFASHEKAEYWSDKNLLKPREVFKATGDKFWFNCNKCKHEFESRLDGINSGSWCSYCAIPARNLCNKEDCIQCFKKSFASHEKAEYWSDKNHTKPRQISKSSGNKYWFKCNNCLHEFKSILSNINKGGWCGYCCVPTKLLCDNNTCVHCFNNSFASHKKSKFLSDKNNVDPRSIFKGSKSQKYLFECNICKKEFQSIINNSGCPYCVNKTEQKLYDNLQPIYNNLEQQYKAEWCKSDTTNKCYPFDFVLADQKIIIELDGLQHFEQVSNWDSPEKVQERDKYKMKQANDNGYSVIRILQEDVYYDTYKWLEELKENIEKLISENKVQNIFICKDNEYRIFDTL